MIYELRGLGVHNKGAELMLQAILHQFRSAQPEISFVVDRWFGTYPDRARYGLLSLLPESGMGRARLATWLLSPGFRRTYGLVDFSEVSAVLDASGFAYSDHWGPDNVRQIAQRVTRCRQRGVPTVLLPQAFGPFTSPSMRSHARQLIEQSALVFAREDSSLAHIRNLGVTGDHVMRAPDFTNLIPGVIPAGMHLPDRFACIVPNSRMLDMTQPAHSSAYIHFLAEAIRALEQHEISPCFLYHDPTSDAAVALQVQATLGRSIRVLSHSCPTALKGILGKSHMVIGSRFHALVGALCQAVPVIATSWSHKYEELLREYGVSDFLIQPGQATSQLSECIAQLADPSEHARLATQLSKRASIIRIESEQIFQRVFHTLGLTDPNRQNESPAPVTC